MRQDEKREDEKRGTIAVFNQAFSRPKPLAENATGKKAVDKSSKHSTLLPEKVRQATSFAVESLKALRACFQ